MTTLEEKYKEIALDSERWSYYKNSNIDIAGAWEKEGTAFDFIVSYFNRGGKKKVFDDPVLRENTDHIKERAPHIISTYMLGIAIAESFGVDTINCNSDNVNFLYLWFMTCLYHDVGYAYEKSKISSRVSAVKKGGLRALINTCGLQYYCNFKRDIKNNGIYSEKDIDIYLKGRAEGRAEERGVIDHGIVGGLLLYDKLRCNFEDAQMKNGHINSEDFYMDVKDGKLHYSDKHFKYYAEAADAIIAHNIWTDTLEKYKNPLTQTNTVKNQPRITLYRNKLAFILSVADTIEPLKRGSDNLSKVSIECCGKYGFSISANQDIYSDLYQDLPKQFAWLSIDVKESLDGQQKIATLNYRLEKN